MISQSLCTLITATLVASGPSSLEGNWQLARRELTLSTGQTVSTSAPALHTTAYIRFAGDKAVVVEQFAGGEVVARCLTLEPTSGHAPASIAPVTCEAAIINDTLRISRPNVRLVHDTVSETATQTDYYVVVARVPADPYAGTDIYRDVSDPASAAFAQCLETAKMDGLSQTVWADSCKHHLLLRITGGVLSSSETTRLHVGYGSETYFVYRDTTRECPP
ncbi:MAG: hypothetical protein GF331_15875 [Chitinivibrionales bacterium]|nr:hypothetical protein [Chitinivibrionales bacterium]